jgi:acyl carrier protein
VTNDPCGKALQQQLIRELQESLQERLPPYMVPAALVALDSLPLTANGKLDYRALAAFAGRHSSQRRPAPASTLTELALSEIWKQVLNLERIGMEDNFFELGGHSLLAVKLTARVSERFAIHLSAVEVLQHPTVRQLAECIERQGSLGAGRPASEQVAFEEGLV